MFNFKVNMEYKSKIGLGIVLMLIIACVFLSSVNVYAATVQDSVVNIQLEDYTDPDSRYDGGANVMKDGSIYKMWFTRRSTMPKDDASYTGYASDGTTQTVTYNTAGDRIYYAESTNGVDWNIDGDDATCSKADYDYTDEGALLVLEPAESANERKHVAQPSVIKISETYYMYYEAPSEFKINKVGANYVLGSEYNNQVFLATSTDGKNWTKSPNNSSPAPIVTTPSTNKYPAAWKYGMGMPRVIYKDSTYIMYYLDSYTTWPNYMVRIEADNPQFTSYTTYANSLYFGVHGSVSKHAEADIKFDGTSWWLLRGSYYDESISLCKSSSIIFDGDNASYNPVLMGYQIKVPETRSGVTGWTMRQYPRFLCDTNGAIIKDGNDQFWVYYTSGDPILPGTRDLRLTKITPYRKDLLQMQVSTTGDSTENRYTYWKFSDKSRVLQSGDCIEYDVKIGNNVFGSGGIDIKFSDGNYARSYQDWDDQNGIGGHPAADIKSYAYNQWYHRKLEVPSSFVGKLISHWDVVMENETASTTFTSYYDNIVITNGGKEVLSVYKGGSPVLNAQDFTPAGYNTPTLTPENNTQVPVSFALLSPADSASGLDRNLELSWENSSGADYYKVIIDNNSNFGSPEIEQNKISQTFWKPEKALNSSTTYYWKVVAYNDNGSVDCSSTRSFTTSANANTTNVKYPFLNENFESYTVDGSATNWTTNGGSWSIKNDGTKVYEQSSTSGYNTSVTGDNKWDDYTITSKFKFTSSASDREISILVRYQNSSNYYRLVIYNSPSAQIGIQKMYQGSWGSVTGTSYSTTVNTWYWAKLKVDGSNIYAKVWEDGTTEPSSWTISTTISDIYYGKIGICTSNASGKFDETSVNINETILTDNFESYALQGGASNFTTCGGTWAVSSSGSKVYSQSNTSGYYKSLTGSSDWKDYIVQTRFRFTSSASDRNISILARFQDEYNYYRIVIYNSPSAEIGIQELYQGSWKPIVSKTSFSTTVNTWYWAKLRVIEHYVIIL